jgi:hypothetical protein
MVHSFAVMEQLLSSLIVTVNQWEQEGQGPKILNSCLQLIDDQHDELFPPGNLARKPSSSNSMNGVLHFGHCMFGCIFSLITAPFLQLNLSLNCYRATLLPNFST